MLFTYVRKLSHFVWKIVDYQGRFPFDQKFRKFRVQERMEQTFSGISFRNFGCTSRGWPKIPENRNNRKIPFHSTIPARAQFLRARKSNSTWLPILLLNISVPLGQPYTRGKLKLVLGVEWQLAQIHSQVVSFLWA